jgi:hypothetical protein
LAFNNEGVVGPLEEDWQKRLAGILKREINIRGGDGEGNDEL